MYTHTDTLDDLNKIYGVSLRWRKIGAEAEVMDQLKGSPVERLHSLSLLAPLVWP